jgi:hypothetical protein
VLASEARVGRAESRRFLAVTAGVVAMEGGRRTATRQIRREAATARACQILVRGGPGPRGTTRDSSTLCETAVDAGVDPAWTQASLAGVWE